MRPVLLDVDTGIDDALALTLAVRHPELDVRAVTCVAGNTAVDQVVRNTLTVLDAAGGTRIPVARGAERPLLAASRDASHVHGEDGLGDLGVPPSPRRPVEIHAVELMRLQLLDSTTPVTMIALAPLTNVALLLRMYPEAAAKLERLVVMGGAASVGNATPVAEFNVWHDPEAAAIVFGAGLPVTMYGLDVFYQVGISGEEAAKLAVSEDLGTCLVGRLLAGQVAKVHSEQRIPPGTATIGDAGAVCAVADPAGLNTSSLPVRVSLEGEDTRGQTIVDRRSRPGESDLAGRAQATRVDVALEVDAERYRRLFLDVACRGEA
ncbi:pyrimidine-specific ribonucleoside hydrolase [Kribbella aluminosa]|uniref:Pyrimidine-specific ribonucleoside hydrolase n=1 Tax=Kribbella aluminosa TaxID=416017 RepID=A0ABS4UIV0_9ACTN|nr:nucleoside hydrolase [Kribbella aluminosa]MBP2351591.1 pyrimidine-specific ribonucleoside hydrolase [Kribbella aluminosa]